MDKLTAAASKIRYETLKGIVRDNIGASRKLWGALTAIKEEKLYLLEYKTWDEFCNDQHDLSSSQANRMIEAAKTEESLRKALQINKKITPTGVISTPMGVIDGKSETVNPASLLNERQLRELAKVPEEKRAEVLAIAASAGPITAASIVAANGKSTSPATGRTEAIAKAPVIELDELGTAITPDGIPFWNRRGEIQKLLTDLSRIKCVVEKAKHDEDSMFGKVSNGILNNFTGAYTQLQEAMPYAVCTECMGRFKVQPKGCSFCGNKGLISKFQWDTQSKKEVKDMRMKVNASRK